METILMRKQYYFSGVGKKPEGTVVSVPPMFAKRFIARGMAVKAPEGMKAEFEIGAQVKTQTNKAKPAASPRSYQDLKADVEASRETKKTPAKKSK